MTAHPEPRGARGRRRWPLLVIGASAGTATWSGWVGLGELTGFGVVHPLPGIWDGLTVNTAITLPVGVEAYAVYALSVATDPRPLTRVARRWAWTSAAGALLLGMAGQIAYHLLDSWHVTAAPWWVVALVSSLPVLVLGAASLLWHLAAAPVLDDTPTADRPAVLSPLGPAAGPTVPVLDDPQREAPEPVPVLDPVLDPVPTVPEPVDPDVGPRPSGPAAAVAATIPGGPAGQSAPGDGDAAIVAVLVRAGRPPTLREIKAAYGVGSSRAVRLRALTVAALADQATPLDVPIDVPQPVTDPEEPTPPPSPGDAVRSAPPVTGEQPPAVEVGADTGPAAPPSRTPHDEQNHPSSQTESHELDVEPVHAFSVVPQ